MRALAAASLLLVGLAARAVAAAYPYLPTETTIWFDAPAKSFTESLPLGNGRLGAMMFGGTDEERVVLNESSVWSGSPQDADRPDAYKVLPEIRRLFLEGKNLQAEALVNANFICQGPGSSGPQYGCYQVLGNLRLSFPGGGAPVTGYRRELNLNDAVASLSYVRGGVTFHREMFSTAPDQVMVLRLWADQPGQISFTTKLDRPERFATTAPAPDELLMTGQLDNGVDGKGVRYAARVKVQHHGGKVSAENNAITIAGADEVCLIIGAATDYRGFAGRQTADPEAQSRRDVNAAARRSYASLRKRHIADYQKYFHRVSLQLPGAQTPEAALPTPRRIEAARAQGDPSLAALYFHFGRYLLISSSRPGGLPPNLQGIWAEELHTPWNGDWHLDVNVEMNYWPAEVCNLSDLIQPLFALTASLQEPGAKTAHDYYRARGWVAHVIANPWGFTSPGESANWGSTTSGSGWLCQHLWDHWLFTHDKQFLAWAYPVMKGAALCYSDMLIEEPQHHWLVTPANSPENSFEMPNGQHASIALGSTFQSQITRYLFTACIESAQILGVDEDFRQKLAAQRARLMPTQIGPDGRVQEWIEPYKEAEPHHRHTSHLWGLYPSDEISARTTPALAQAARRSLEARGDDGVGWSLAFKACLWARLQDGNHAWQLVRKALAPAYGMDIRYDAGGGVYQNLFDTCPPFQIDGNFGTTAAIGEMLVQSEHDVVQLLPALPDDWKDGTAAGLRARGGFQVDITWKDHRLTQAVIRPDADGPAQVSYRGQTRTIDFKKGKSVTLAGW
ncbi:MAG TPA: glycoside hydrolase family 95 protein [Verrucomicrobiae bacterium]|jgi:alpha-L-fucosidase 2|nr:glycoside hydrolase family 95 protein [Verrucomicrobiae bacterium]